MRAIIERPATSGEPAPPLWRRLAWFVGLAVAGTLVTAGLAYGMKALLPPLH